MESSVYTHTQVLKGLKLPLIVHIFWKPQDIKHYVNVTQVLTPMYSLLETLTK